jgi:cell division protein FtsW
MGLGGGGGDIFPTLFPVGDYRNMQGLQRGSPDNYVLLIVFVLTCLGVIMAYSAPAPIKYSLDHFYIIKRHGCFAAVGFALLLIARSIDYHLWKKLAVWILASSIVLLILVFVPGVGESYFGAASLINLGHGFHFEPTELAKLAMILYLAYSFDKKQEKMKTFGPGFISYMLVLFIFIILFLEQPDLSSSIIMFLLVFSMLFVAGTRVKYLFSVFLLFFPFLYYLLINGPAYRLRRIAELFTWDGPHGICSHIMHSLMSLGTGGAFGHGLFAGIHKQFDYPDYHTVFIFELIAQEMGAVGAVAIITLFIVLVLKGLRIAKAAGDAFGKFLALGIAILIGIEVTLSVGVDTGVIPTKGVLLPFISYGGNSLLMHCLAIGILLNISSWRPPTDSDIHHRAVH